MTDTLSTYRDRIVQVWHLATTAEHNVGMQWYADALTLAAELDPTDPRRGAGVIAVLSPMTSWAQNVANARSAYAGISPPTLSRNAAKAMAMARGGRPERYVSGPKVTAFWLAICGESGPATIDRHAGDICLGRPCTDTERELSLRKGGRKLMQAAYALAATDLGVTTHQVQAVTWVAWRRVYDIKAARGITGYRAITPLTESVHAELSEAKAAVTNAVERELGELTGWMRAEWSVSQTDAYSQFLTRTLPDALRFVGIGTRDSASVRDPLHGAEYRVEIMRG